MYRLPTNLLEGNPKGVLTDDGNPEPKFGISDIRAINAAFANVHERLEALECRRSLRDICETRRTDAIRSDYV